MKALNTLIHHAHGMPLLSVAKRYVQNVIKQVWLDDPRQRAFDPTLLQHLANIQDDAKDDWSNPKVAASYNSFIAELELQFLALVAAGFTFTSTSNPWPYKSSREMIQSVKASKHLVYFASEPIDSFHYLYFESPFTDSSGRPMLYNDILRVVHDMFGHVLHGYSFSAEGEYNAWQAHRATLKPSSYLALACETLYQNAFVNFGPHMQDENGNLLTKEDSRYLLPPDRPYAEQKQFLAPVV